MKQTKLKMIARFSLRAHAIDKAMAGNSGIAAINIKNAYEGSSMEEAAELAKKLTLIELEARKQMEAAIQNFINS